jgi:hypothetical protein
MKKLLKEDKYIVGHPKRKKKNLDGILQRPFHKVPVTREVRAAEQTGSLGFMDVRTDRRHVQTEGVSETSRWQGYSDGTTDNTDLKEAIPEGTDLSLDQWGDL